MNPMRRRLRFSIVIAVTGMAVLFVACGTGSERAASAPSPTVAQVSNPELDGAPSGALVFLSLGNLASSIYAVNPDGSDLVQFTDGISIDSNPRWSPDGTRIAFSSADRGNGPGTDVYVMDADGKNERKLTNSENGNSHNFDSWSPDGSHILYDTATIAAGDMWVTDADGGNAVRIAETVWCSLPDWSPDGKRLVGCQCEQGERTGCSLFLVNADGSGLITLIESSGNILAPRWSPDGTRLFYTDGQHQPSVGVYVVDLPDGKPRKVYEGRLPPDTRM